MVIVTSDGRTFAGTALQIVQGMRSAAFNASEVDLLTYMEQAARRGGLEVDLVTSRDIAALAEGFVKAMLAADFARKVEAAS